MIDRSPYTCVSKPDSIEWEFNFKVLTNSNLPSGIFLDVYMPNFYFISTNLMGNA